MNNIITTTQAQLPDTLPDLAKFVLIGRDKLKAVRAEIHAIDKVGIAKEVYQQKLGEAQEIAEVVTDAECRMGELLKATIRQGGDRRSEKSKSSVSDLEKIGISKNQSSQFQQMASHPESVQKAKDEAKRSGEVVSRSAVLKQIEKDKPIEVKPAKPFNAEKTLRKNEYREIQNKFANLCNISIGLKDERIKCFIEFASKDECAGYSKHLKEIGEQLIKISQQLEQSN